MSDLDDIFSKFQNLRVTTDKNPYSKEKIEKEWSKNPPQTYIGEVFQGNLHRHGFYFVEEGEKLFYDGLFYANKLEGYAQVFYNDGSNFQGLFKNNIRYGPGVLTYPNGDQDVGLWNGQHLGRLGGVNQRNLVPRLANTPLGQLKLLKYRYLVPVGPKCVDSAYDTLKRLGANSKILQRSDELYNLEVVNERNIFFNKKLFDRQFHGNQDNCIDIALKDAEVVPDEHAHTNQQDHADDLDVHVERVKQISEILEIIEKKLEEITRKRVILQDKVENCRACCYKPPKRVYFEPAEEETNLERNISVTIQTPYTEDEQKESQLEGFATEEEMCHEENIGDIGSIYSDFFHTQTDSQVKNYLVGGDCNYDEATYPKDLDEMEKQLEVLTRDELFYESITFNLRKKLEKHLKKSEGSIKVKTKKIVVEEVLSWNNEKHCMRMMKHSFLHRRSEYMVNFKVCDLISGRRHYFGNPGLQEKHCTEFLRACGKGNLETIYELIKNDINVNVCDGKGNNGMFFAAINCHRHVIKALVNLGVNLDQENDEGLVPLTVCLLVYLAQKHRVNDWEVFFLPHVEPVTEHKETHKWYHNMSLLSLENHKRKASLSANKTSSSKLTYIFDTSYVDPKYKDRSSSIGGSFVLHKTTSFLPTIELVDIKLVQDSIKTLLEYGANPNASCAPQPALILSLFTEEPSLVECMLDANADINTIIEDDLTCLHIIASAKFTEANIYICRLLVTYECDASLKTSTNHWLEQKMEILGKNVNPDDVQDFGKNPLHILCMRRDFLMDSCFFFERLAAILRNSDMDYNERYLGHTPLSLAVLVGNQPLVETIMSFNVIDPHQTLDYNMGNVLTLYILKRYDDIIPLNAKQMLECLVRLGVNPLKPIGKYANAIEFAEKEHAIIKDTNRKKNSMQAPKEKDISQKKLKEYIKQLGREAIKKYIQLKAVENLYNLIEDDCAEHDCVTMLARFLTPDLVIPNLQLLFRYRKMKSDRFHENISLQLINIVKREFQKKEDLKQKKNTKRKKPIQQTESSDFKKVVIEMDYALILNTTDFRPLRKTKTKFKLLPPGLDNTTKYQICFHCLQKTNKTLLVCPKCQLVYFCSDACNKANLKLTTEHHCNVNFYASLSENVEEQECFEDVYKRAKENCEKKRRQKFENEKEMQRKQFLEEMKSDVYGTKLLKRMNRDKNTVQRTPTTISLLGSFSYFSKFDGFDLDNTADSIANRTYSGYLKLEHSSKELLKKVSIIKKSHVASKTLPQFILEETVCKNRNQECTCEECTKLEKKASRIKCICPPNSDKKTKKTFNIQDADLKKDMTVALKKLREIPKRYQDFIKLLTEYFPNVDFSSMLLPYACYSNGQLYYKFLDTDYFTRSYSMV